MPEGYRTVQMFLSAQGDIDEVGVETDGDGPRRRLHCTCEAFTGKDQCCHSEYVRRTLKSNRGAYPIRVHGSVPEDVMRAAAKADDAGFRDFVLHHGKVVLL